MKTNCRGGHVVASPVVEPHGHSRHQSSTTGTRFSSSPTKPPLSQTRRHKTWALISSAATLERSINTASRVSARFSQVGQGPKQNTVQTWTSLLKSAAPARNLAADIAARVVLETEEISAGAVRTALKRTLSSSEKAVPPASKSGALVSARAASFEKAAEDERAAALEQQKQEQWLAARSNAQKPLPGRQLSHLGRQLSFGRTLSGRQLSFQRRKKKAEANGEAVAPPVAAPAASAAPAEIDEAPIMSVTMRRKSIEIY